MALARCLESLSVRCGLVCYNIKLFGTARQQHFTVSLRSYSVQVDQVERKHLLLKLFIIFCFNWIHEYKNWRKSYNANSIKITYPLI